MVSEEAVNAAAEALADNICYRPTDENGHPDDDAYYAHIARAALAAAMPHIRQELAAELQSRADYVMRGVTTETNIPPFASGLRLAARLVEGQTNE